MIFPRMIAPLVRYRRVFAVLLGCYWLALFIGTHIPLSRLADLPKHSDKGMHFLAYGGLSFLLILWLSTVRPIHLKHYLLIFTLTALYAAADELLQIPVVGRNCDLFDALADCTGSALGLFSAAALKKLLLRHWQPAEFPQAT